MPRSPHLKRSATCLLLLATLSCCSWLPTTPPSPPISSSPRLDPTALCPEPDPIGPQAAREAAALADGAALDRWIKRVAVQQTRLKICVEKQTDFE